MNQIKELILNPEEFRYADVEITSKGKHYYASADVHGHVAIPSGVEPGDSISVSYPVPEASIVNMSRRIPTLEPKRIPRSQRIPHLQRGGYRPRK